MIKYMWKKILSANLAKISQRIEKKFNTKVLDYGVIENNNSSIQKQQIPFELFDSNIKHICYLIIVVDDYDNIITYDYYEKSSKVQNQNSLLGSFAAYEFQSILNKDTDVCNFISESFHGRVYTKNIHGTHLGQFEHINCINDISKIEIVQLRVLYYLAS